MNPYREPGKPTSSRLREFFVNRTRVLWPTFVILAALSSIAATAALRINGMAFGPNDNTSFITADNSRAFVTVNGAIGDGVTDATSAVQAAYSRACASGPGVKVVWPAGNFVITNTITVNCNYLHTEGAGTYATRITFNPSTTASLFNVSNGASSVYGFSARNLLLIGQGTQKKTAFNLSDCRACDLQDIEIYSGWTGSTSVGVHILGREFITIERFRAAADLPIQVSVDPNSATIGLDHSHFKDVYLFPTTGGGNSAILIDTGVILTNLTLDGHQSYIVDKYGIYYNDTTTTQAGANIRLAGIRCEQAQDPTGYCIYWNEAGSSVMQNVTLDDVYTGTAQNGLTINGVRNLSLRNVEAPTTSAVELSTTNVSDLFIDNCYWQSGGTASLTGLVQMPGAPKINTGSPLPPTAWYSDTTTAAKGWTLSTLLNLNGMVWTNSDSGSANPFKINSSSAWTGAAEFWSLYNNSVRKLYADGNGNVWSKGGTFDTDGSVALQLGLFNASSVTVGKTSTNTTLSGGQLVHRTTVSDANYTTAAGDYIVAETAMTAGRTITIQCTVAGREFIIKNESSGAFAITITPASGTCDGAASCATTAAAHAAAVRVYADGTNCNTF